MLATILKSSQATQTTIAIIEAFAKLRELSRTIGEMSANPDQFKQKTLMQKSGEIMADLFEEDMQTTFRGIKTKAYNQAQKIGNGIDTLA